MDYRGKTNVQPNLKSSTLKKHNPIGISKPEKPKAQQPKTGPTTRSIKTSGGGGYRSTYKKKSPY